MTNAGSHPPSTIDPAAALKKIRTEKGWTLADVSKLTNYPVSSLSKIENGRTELTIEKLSRITLALGVNMVDLFGIPSHSENKISTSRRRSITRADQGKIVSSKSGKYTYLAIDLLEKLNTPIVAEITARSLEEFGGLHSHAGEEFVYVLSGELILYTDTYSPAHLEVGDSMYFDSSMGHAYINGGDTPCRILSISSTPVTDSLSPLESGEALVTLPHAEMEAPPSNGKR